MGPQCHHHAPLLPPHTTPHGRGLICNRKCRWFLQSPPQTRRQEMQGPHAYGPYQRRRTQARPSAVIGYSKCAEMVLVCLQLEQLLPQICGRIVLPNCARTRPPTDCLLLRLLPSQFTTVRQDIRRVRDSHRRILRGSFP